jgi:hypothetical protein
MVKFDDWLKNITALLQRSKNFFGNASFMRWTACVESHRVAPAAPEAAAAGAMKTGGLHR